ncbi:hypothetical protein IQ243_01020 [Nostocales cyanobacterium LEGE 11386]|nr:hypothetical protein [Nostocales cyanobacterium LEGE 11386]
MSKQLQKDIESSQDIRLTATTKIWGMTVGILVICIPLSSVTKSGPILPLAAIGGAAVGTIAIWRADEKKSKNQYLQSQQMELLEQRLVNLETIVSSDDFDLRMKIKQLKISDSTKPNINEDKA